MYWKKHSSIGFGTIRGFSHSPRVLEHKINVLDKRGVLYAEIVLAKLPHWMQQVSREGPVLSLCTRVLLLWPFLTMHPPQPQV